MASKQLSLQELFLDSLYKQQISVAIFLVNGIKLQGKIIAFDAGVLILKGVTKQVVFKHAIASIVPTVDIDLGVLLDV